MSGVRGLTVLAKINWYLVNNNDDILDGNKDNNQQEIQQRRVDVILLPPTVLFRRIGGGLVKTGTKHGGRGALEDEDIRDDNNVLGG